MKATYYILLLGTLFMGCSSVAVFSDFDSAIDFSQYSSYAYLKKDIDAVAISDLDKRRILRNIDTNMAAKGLTKSATPDLLIRISTQSKERVYVNNNYWGWAWGWNPWFMGPQFQNISSRTEGILFIDLIDGKSKQLVWQGRGRGPLTEMTTQRDERIAKLVHQILTAYPPEAVD
ncbi:MAG: DUF4136 domain-containing protein [Flavobacteriaceae bacterium]